MSDIIHTYEPQGKPVTNGAEGQRRATAGVESSTREALLVATRTCVRDYGVARTTSRLIATTAGANLGAITYYFGGKDELVAEALLGELLERIQPALTHLQGDDEPTATRLLSAIGALVSDFERSADEVPVYLDAVMGSTRPGPLADRAAAVVGELRRQIADTIAAMQADGIIASWVEPDAMAALLVAAGNGIALQTQIEPDGPSVSQLAGQLGGLLLAASNRPSDTANP